MSTYYQAVLRLEVSALIPKCPSPSAGPFLRAWLSAIEANRGNFLLPSRYLIRLWQSLHKSHWMLGKLFLRRLLLPEKDFGGGCSRYEYHGFSAVQTLLLSFAFFFFRAQDHELFLVHELNHRN